MVCQVEKREKREDLQKIHKVKKGKATASLRKTGKKKI